MAADLEWISANREPAKACHAVSGFRITPPRIVVEMLVELLWRQFVFGLFSNSPKCPFPFHV